MAAICRRSGRGVAEVGLRRRWVPPPGLVSTFSSRWVQIPLAVAVVVVLMIPTYLDPSKTGSSDSGAKVLSSPPGVPPGDWPGYIPASQFPSPDNITGPGQFSSVHVAAGVLGTSPVLWLIYVSKVPGGHWDLEFQSGSYDANQAWALANGAFCKTAGYSCEHNYVTWSAPSTLLNSSTSITGTAITASGAAVAIGYASGSSVTFEMSLTGGASWIALGTEAGSNPFASSNSVFSAFTYMLGGYAYVFYSSWSPCSSPVVSPSGLLAQNVSAVALGTTTVGLVTSYSGEVHYTPYNATLNGFQTSRPVESVAASSTSSLFNSVGATELAAPGGYPGQVTVTSVGSTLFAAYTTSVNGQVILATSVSGTGGLSWQGPFYAYPTDGVVQDPQIAVTPTGTVEVAWRSTDNGTWEQQLALFSQDGRLLAGPTSAPASGGLASRVDSSSGLVVDAWGRPFLVWSAVVPGGNQIEFAGADISPASALTDLDMAAKGLVPLDFAGDSSAHRTTFLADVMTVQSEVSSGSYASAISSLENSVYPAISASPLVLDCDSAPYTCQTILPGSGQLVLAVGGTDSPLAYLTNLTVLALEALGVGVRMAVQYGSFPPLLACPGGSQQQVIVLSSGTSGGASPLVIPQLGPYANISGGASSAQAHAAQFNPKSANLTILSSFPLNWTSRFYRENVPGCGQACDVSDCNITYEFGYSLTVSISTAYEGTLVTRVFTGLGNLTVIHLTNLTYGGATYFAINETAHYKTVSQVFTGAYGCAGITPAGVSGSDKVLSYSNVSLGGPTGSPGAVWGVVYTTLNTSAPALVETSSTSLHASWAASQSLNGTWLNKTSGASGVTISELSRASNSVTYSLTGLGSGYYNFSESSRTQRASVPPISSPGVSEANTVNAGHSLGVSTTKEVCSLGADPLDLWGVGIANVTTSNATLSWFENIKGNTTISLGTWGLAGVSLSETGFVGAAFANGTVKTVAEVHGLYPWAVYNVTLSVNFIKCGIEYITTINGGQLLTPSDFSIWEIDQPFDSISQVGGGALLAWEVPVDALSTLSFVNGTAYYWPASNRSAIVTVPFSSYDQPTGLSYVGGLNITPSEANTTYSSLIVMNFSVRAHPTTIETASSWEYNFTYLADPTGDGLTTVEKIHGWPVTTTGVTGTQSRQLVSANPNSYATNGLVSDYIEKEYGLNPNTVDSAGSHMLDTWNLTFDLGPISAPAQPPGAAPFRYWADNSSYDPFTVCLYPAQNPCGATSVIEDASNLTDDGPGDSSVLWSLSALYYFVNLTAVRSAGWLRAVYGTDLYDTYGERRTLTVEGKLSWGANPLAASTPINGIADGLRINPLYSVGLEIGSLSATLTHCQPIHGGVSSYGWSPRIFLNWSSVAGPAEVRNYTAAAQDSSTTGTTNCGAVTGYNVVIPVNGTSQYQSLQLQLVLNQSYSPQVLKLQKFVGGSGSEINVSYDMVAGATIRYPATSTYSGTNATLNFTLAEVAVGTKANTLIWQPSDNSSISSLPWGLKRWAGDDGIAEIAVYAPTSVTSDSIPYAQNSSESYRLTLPVGLTNIVVPRGALYTSVWGKAILQNRQVGAWTGGAGLPPMIDSQDDGWIAYGSSNNLVDLECYWQNRAINDNVSGPTEPICNGTAGLGLEAGTARGTNLSLTTNIARTWAWNNSGGLPSDPGAENNSDAGAALQVFARMNISSKSEWDLLLASLLDNVTGGVNGTLSTVQPYQLASLGLPVPVWNAMANYTYTSDGLLPGIPRGSEYVYVDPCAGWDGGNELICSILSGSASGVVLVSAGLLIASPWIGLAPLQIYLSDTEPWLVAVGASAVTATALYLSEAGDLIAGAMNAAAKWIEGEVADALSGVTAPVTSSASAARVATYQADSLEANYSGSGGDPAALSTWINGNYALFTATQALGQVAVTAGALLIPFAPFLGPVSIVIVPLIETALGIASATGSYSLSGSVPATVQAIMNWALEGADGVFSSFGIPTYIAPTEGDGSLLAAMLLVPGLAFSLLGAIRAPSLAGIGLIMFGFGLAVLGMITDATAPCNYYMFPALSEGVLFAVLGAISDLAGGALSGGPIGGAVGLAIGLALVAGTIVIAIHDSNSAGC